MTGAAGRLGDALLALGNGLLFALFVVYGVALLPFAAHSPAATLGLGVGSAAYGALGLVLLLRAWRGVAGRGPRVLRVAAVALFVVFAVVSMDVAVVSPLELLAIVVLAAVLWLNGFLLARLVRRRGPATG